MDPAAHPALAPLGYSRLWLDYGLLSPDVLDGQLALFRSEGATAPGPYRLGAFVEAVHQHALTDETVARLVELARLDPDATLRQAMLEELLRHPALSDAAFETVAAAAEWKDQRRHRVLRELRRIGPTPVVLARCLATRDGEVHEALLGVAGIDDESLDELAKHGAWRRVRHAATELLRARRSRAA